MTDAVAPRRPRPPSPGQVAALQAGRSYPSVSLITNTVPAPRMAPPDAANLQRLAAHAVRRLSAEGLDDAADAVLDRLQTLCATAAADPTDQAVAVYASEWTGQVVHLPVRVQERVVVDPTFATRDLLRALHHAPRHVVLVLTGEEARLFDGVAGVLRPAVRSRFPLRRSDVVPEPRRDTLRHTGQHRGTGAAVFLRAVDRALVAYLRLHPAPLVLVGPQRLVAEFRAATRATRIAGAVTGSRAQEPLEELARLTRPVLDDYLHSRQTEALQLLEQRGRGHQAVWGLEDCWLAARRERPEMLAVEDTLARAVRLAADGDVLLPAEDPEEPDVIDDVVDELIELVLDRGGWVALLEEGALADRGGVALTLRTA